MGALSVVMADDPLTRAKAGDGQAFAVLLEPLVEPAYRLAVTILRDRAAAEDAVQEAALKAWRKLDGFRPEAELRPWFLTIVANQCRSAGRSRWRQVLRLAAPPMAGSASEVAMVERLDLKAALDRLPRQHLLVLTLYYRLDLPIEEVARVLGCSPGAARVRLHRALKALRPALELEVTTR